jgi:cyanophycinase
MQKTILLLAILLSSKAMAAKFFYNDNFLTYYTTHDFSIKNKDVSRMVIVVHGALRNGDEYFADTVAAAKKHGVDKHTMIVAPHFRRESDQRLVGEIYYGNRWNTKWKYGYKSQDSDSVSSFTLIDTMISRIEKSDRFPNLKSIVITGHSAGGQFTQRYSVGSMINSKVVAEVEFVPSNPSSYMFLGEERFEFKKGNFELQEKSKSCSEYNHYIYGPINRARYLKQYSISSLKKIFRLNKLTYLMSEDDKGTDSLDRSCEAMLQGKNRFERAKNFWHYDKKILGGEKHRFISIPNTGHEHIDVYESAEAGEVIFGLKKKKHQSFLYKKIGNNSDVQASSKELYLLLGGGKNEESGFTQFLKSAGGGDVLVISAKPELNQRYTHDLWNIAEDNKIDLDSVETISFLSSKAGSKAFVINKIKNAEAIFFTGGNQARYLLRIKGTKAHKALLRKIKDGAPVAGTSAGLAVMGEYIFSAKKGGLSSSYVLRNPHASEIIIDKGFLEIEALSGLITDTHFMNRSREGRLLTFMFRTQFDFELTSLAGVGIDEQSSLLVTRNKMLPKGGVHFYQKPLGIIPSVQSGKLNYGPLLKKTLVENKIYPHFKKIKFRKTIKVTQGVIK